MSIDKKTKHEKRMPGLGKERKRMPGLGEERLPTDVEGYRKLAGRGRAELSGVRADVVLYFENQTNNVKGLYQIPADEFPEPEEEKPGKEVSSRSLQIDNLVNRIYDDYMETAMQKDDQIRGVKCEVIAGVKMDYEQFDRFVVLNAKNYARQVMGRLSKRLGITNIKKYRASADELEFVEFDVHVDDKGLDVKEKVYWMPKAESKLVYASMEEFMNRTIS